MAKENTATSPDELPDHNPQKKSGDQFDPALPSAIVHLIERGRGKSNLVLLNPDGRTVRLVPLTKEAREMNPRIHSFLGYFREHLRHHYPAILPLVARPEELHEDGESHQTVMPGKAMNTGRLRDHLSEEQVQVLARTVADFLTALHTMPVEGIQSLTDPNSKRTALLDPDKFTAIFSNAPELSPKQKNWILRFYRVFQKVVSQSQITPCVRHSDLYLNTNVHFSPQGNLSGVVDFGNISIGDGAYDFRELNYYHPVRGDSVRDTFDFGKLVRDAYRGPKDALFETRCRLYEAWCWINYLQKYYTMKIKPENARQRIEKIAQRKRQLDFYIESGILDDIFEQFDPKLN